MNGKKIFGLILIILAVLLHFITAWPWWIKLVILAIGIIMLLCKCKTCVKKEPEVPAEEKEPEVEEKIEEPIGEVKEEEAEETPVAPTETTEEVEEEKENF